MDLPALTTDRSTDLVDHGSLDEALGVAHTVLGPDAELTLVRTGSAVLLRSGDLAVRISGPAMAPRDVVHAGRAARYLARAGYPAMVPLRIVVVGTSTVTLSTWVDRSGDSDIALAGRLGAELHRIPAPRWLRPFDPLTATRRRIAPLSNSGDASPGELTLLRGGLDRAEHAWGAWEGGPVGVVHGDLNSGNILLSADGPLVHDFDTVGVGPVYFDLVPAWHHVRRSGDDRSSFFAAYRGAGGTVDEQCLDAVICVTDIVQAAWALARRTFDADAYGPDAARRLAFLDDQAP